MHRDILGSNPLTALASATDDQLAIAVGVIAAVTNAHALTSTQRERLERAYASIGTFMAEREGLGVNTQSIDVQGSLAIGATTRPEHKTEMDVDLVWLVAPGTQHVFAPCALLDVGFDALGAYAKQHGLGIERKRRCIQLQYVDDMHADITPVVLAPRVEIAYGETFGLVPDRDVLRYADTNPAGFAQWFNEAAAIQPTFLLRDHIVALAKAEVLPLPAAEVFDRLLSRLVQFVKIHRNKAFAVTPEVAPPSVVLTALITEAYLARRHSVYRSPVHLLLEIWEEVPRLIRKFQVSGGELWWLSNPAAPADNLADRMNTLERQRAFETWHLRFTADLIELTECPRRQPGLDGLAGFAKRALGRHAAEALVAGHAATTNTQRAYGRVFIPSRAAVALGSATSASASFAVARNTHFGRG